jgi:hypothetical protein
MNASGDVVFNGALAGTGITSSNSEGVWTWRDGTLQLIARAGSTGPGPGLGAGVNFSSVASPHINSASDVAFLGFVTGTGVNSSNYRGIWRTTGGTLQLIARTGANGPGPGIGAAVSFSSFNGLIFNVAGDALFRGALTGTGISNSNDSGLWILKDGSLEVVARAGSSGPGPNLGAGIDFASFSSHALSSSGGIAFEATLAGTNINSSNNSGIWVSIDGSLSNIVRTGDAFDVDPSTNADLRTISDIGLLSGRNGEDGVGQALNAEGLLVFRLGFTDGSNGIFTAQISSGPTSTRDFDADGDVDGRDFLVWQRGGSPTPLSAGDLADWQGSYGVGSLKAVSTAAEAASPVSVPEPGILPLFLVLATPLWRGVGACRNRSA